MIQITPDIDYKNNFFEHPELSRIIGKPNTATLITLQAEIRDNAQSVQTILGGGGNGHLGLVCSNETYQELVPGVKPYLRPDNPGPLDLDQDNRLTQYQIAQECDQHAKAIQLFRKVLCVNAQSSNRLLRRLSLSILEH